MPELAAVGHHRIMDRRAEGCKVARVAPGQRWVGEVVVEKADAKR